MQTERMLAAIFNEGVPWEPDIHVVKQVYGNGRLERLAELTDLYPEFITRENFADHQEKLGELEVIFSTWGMFPLTGAQLDQLPKLKAVFHAGGASGHFRGPLQERGIKVCSSAAANAIPVAEFALSQILLAGAGYFRNIRECVDTESTRQINTFRGHGNYHTRVAILGDGVVSRQLRKFLEPHDLEVVVVSSYPERRTISLEEAFSTAFAVVNLFPDLENNAGIYDAPLFERMIDSSVFINVGRGRQVNEAGLVAVLKKRPDLTALLDVQYPEPPEPGSGLFALPNILLTPHIAGSKATELTRMADYMIDEFLRFERGEPLRHAVQPDQL